MYVQWKPLLFLGIMFWITLLSTDVLRRHKIFESFIPDKWQIILKLSKGNTVREFPPLNSGDGVSFGVCASETHQTGVMRSSACDAMTMCSSWNGGRQTLDALFELGGDEPPAIFASTKKENDDKKTPSSSMVLETTSSDKLTSDLGLTMALVNIVIFVVSIVFCSIAKFVATIVCNSFRKRPEVVPSPEPEKLAPAKTITISDNRKQRIAESKEGLLKTTSSSNTEMKESTDQICQTIFHTSVPLKHDQTLKAECCKLREELLMVQSNSIKEHALLSRKLDATVKEKKELNKRLSGTLKENNVAKMQIDEMMEEKKLLQKRLDNVTKESRLSMKTKKVALARLEEMSATVDDLKSQLEQVTRDKEILQGKLQVLRTEYEKMQERLRIMQIKETNRINEERNITLELEKAEKDENIIVKSNEDPSTCDSSQSSLNRLMSKESVYLPYVISQTELDMKNIQRKIIQLENSIKGFGSGADILQEITGSDKNAEQELEASINKSSEEAEKLDEKLGSVLAKMKSAREDLTSKKSYDEMKLHLLRNALKEKIKILENIKDKGEESSRNGCMSETSTVEEDDFEMSSEETSSPRLVSNSQAFQRFLKNIGAETAVVNIGDTKLNTECK